MDSESDSEEEEEMKAKAEESHKLITTEERAVGKVSWRIYATYMAYSGGFPIYSILFLIYTFESIFRGSTQVVR